MIYSRQDPFPKRSNWKMLPLQVGLCASLASIPSMVYSQDRLPNVVVIMADDIGYDDLAVYGQDFFETPRTSELASQGLRLTAAYSPSAVCTPTRYGVVTGTDPFRRYHNSHVLFNAEPLIIGESEWTIGQMFQELGYRTGVVGKWHLGLGDQLPRDLHHPGRGPNEVGFDYSFIVPDGHNMFPRVYHENGEIYGGPGDFPSRVEITRRLGYSFLIHRSTGDWENRRPDEQIGATLADKVDAFIEENAGQPFFLYYPTCSIHFPLTPDPRFVGKSGIGPHGDFVIEFDWAVGRVMDTLERLGLTENTILIVTSDNGGYGADGHGGALRHTPFDPSASWRGAKASRYEGGFRVPFIIRWPGQIPAGEVSDLPMSLVDFSGSFAGILDYPLPYDAALDSRDVSPQWTHPQENNQVRTHWVTGTRGMEHVSIYRMPWKLIVESEGERRELFHLLEDPMETRNRAADEPELVEELFATLNLYFSHGSSRPGASAVGNTLEEIFAERELRNQKVERILRELEGAAPEVSESATTPSADKWFKLQLGEVIFTDRDYRFIELPDVLQGKRFLRRSLAGPVRIEVESDGMVYVMTTIPGVNNHSQGRLLEEQGFSVLEGKEFQMFNRRPGNRSQVYAKEVEEGDFIEFDTWAVMVMP